MKQIKYLLTLLIITTCLYSQNNRGKTDDVGRIAIAPIVGEIEDMPASAEKMLLNKMNQILSKNGMSSFSNRFIMFPNVTILDQNIIASAPPTHAYTLEITLSIADNKTQTIYHSASMEKRGVGKNPTKAYIQALKTLNAKHNDIKDLVETAKNKIVEFYNSECDFILKEAESKAKRKKYDEAIYELTSIPKICKECFEKGQDTAIEVYKQKMDNECMELIAKAKAAKAKNNYNLAASYLASILPDVSCYKDAQVMLKEIEDHRCNVALGKAKGAWAGGDSNGAARWLGEISTDSKCAQEASQLGSEIKSKLQADEDRDWDFKLRAWDDKVELQKNSIQAIRDIGVAYGENQQPTDITWISRRY